MKIKKIELKDYLQFKDLTIDLIYPKGHKKEGQPLDKICIIGQSGVGKTNLLEVIRDKVYTNNVKTYITNNKESDSEEIYFKDIKNITLKDKNDNPSDKEFNNYIKIANTKVKGLFFDILIKILLPILIIFILFWSFKSDNQTTIIFNIEPFAKLYIMSIFFIIIFAILLLYSKFLFKYISENKSDLIQRYIQRQKYIILDESVWYLLNKQINNYSKERSSYQKRLSDKLLNEEHYEKKDFLDGMKKWESKNKNILNEISNKLNEILLVFNLQLTKIDKKTKEYNDLIFKDLSNNKIIKYDNLSTGTKNIISTFIPLKIHNPKDSIILIDEPENSFYPDIQRELTELYMEVGENNQLIFATHSPLIASSFEPWEVVELKFDKNNQIYRELYYKGDNHIDNYTLDPRLLTWTGILTKIFDLEDDSNIDRKKELMRYVRLKGKIKILDNSIEEEEELIKLSKKLGLSN